MRIALVADTHLPRFGRALPPALVTGLHERAVERILHAGDWTTELAAGLLAAIAPVEGVAGNNDEPALRARLDTRRVVELDGVRIGLTHGHLGPGRTTADRAERAFAGEVVDAIVFGHSHLPSIARRADGTWLVNPGSPTDRRRGPRFSWALLTTNAGRVAAVELVEYLDRST